MLRKLRQRTPTLFAGGRLIPLLAGATVRGRLLACLGTLIGVCLTGAACAWLIGKHDAPLLAAPIGASALLLFVVPSSPLAQPWPIIAGNTLSAIIGVLCIGVIDDPTLRAGVAVALAIAAMSLIRALHPPGGACALAGSMTAASGVESMQYITAIGLDSVALVVIGVLFHKLVRQSYPHTPAAPAPQRTQDIAPARRAAFLPQDIDSALSRMNQAYDIDRDDLEQLVREVALTAATRTTGVLRIGDIMSRDVQCVTPATRLPEVRSLLLDRRLRTLPVIDTAGRLLGVIGLREMAMCDVGTRKEDDLTDVPDVAACMAPAMTTSPTASVHDVLPMLIDGRHHAVIVTDDSQGVIGVVTQTDLLATLGYRLLGEQR